MVGESIEVHVGWRVIRVPASAHALKEEYEFFRRAHGYEPLHEQDLALRRMEREAMDACGVLFVEWLSVFCD